MVQMSDSQTESFFQTPRYAVFGTNSIDGPPQLTTVWFLYEARVIYVGIERRSVKYRNLARNPGVSMCIDGEHPDGHTVVVYGHAEFLETGTPESDGILWRLARRYHDSDEDAQRYQESVRDLDFVLVKVIPQKLVAMNYGADLSQETDE